MMIMGYLLLAASGALRWLAEHVGSGAAVFSLIALWRFLKAE